MSAVLEARLDLGNLQTDIVDTKSGQKIRQASAIRWVWQALTNIKLFGNLGAEFLNSLTLAQPPVTEMKRCMPYPLTNCDYEVSLHERQRYSYQGIELPENDLPGNYDGQNPQNTGAPAHVLESKFAYSAARELSESYSKDFGLVVLDPLTGVDDTKLVRTVFELVQPVTWRLVTLERDLKEQAQKRIAAAQVSDEIKAIAEACRKLMVVGVDRAMATARARHGDLQLHIQNAGAGRKGSRTHVWPADIFTADQLGVEVPRVVQTESKSDTNAELLAKLAERELARGNENDPLVQALAMLEEEREARRALEARMDAFLATQEQHQAATKRRPTG